MNNTDLARSIQAATGLSLDHSRRAAGDIFQDIANALLAGEKVTLPLLGSLKVEPTNARLGHHPRTGESIAIPGGERVRFIAGSQIKSQLAERNQDRKAA